MKTLLTFVTSFAALSVLAQNPPTPNNVDPFPPPTPEPPVATATAPRPATKARRTEVRPGGLPGVMAQAAAPAAEANAAGKGGVGLNVTAKNNFRFAGLDSALPRSVKTGRTLVIQTSDPDPETLSNAEEDLSVMAVILRKATGVSQADDKRMVMGIEVFGSSSGARNIYLEGYGALFLLGVRFPLVAPQDDTNETKVKNAESSDWAEAREELLNSERDGIEAQIERVWVAGGRQPAEDYDGGKVEELKTALLESLKNATHIRALKPEDNVTVVIQGAEVSRKGKPSKSGSNRSRSDSRRSETVMTLRVKKSDVDNFARGSLDAEGFRKKVSVQTYLRRADSSVATSLFTVPK